jgi:uncharacterized protein YuzE
MQFRLESANSLFANRTFFIIIWIDYDEEADVLYVSFRKPQRANDSLLEDNIIYHYRDRDLVGLTVLKASDFNSGDSENKINGSENPEMG